MDVCNNIRCNERLQDCCTASDGTLAQDLSIPAQSGDPNKPVIVLEGGCALPPSALKYDINDTAMVPSRDATELNKWLMKSMSIAKLELQILHRGLEP